MSLSALSGVSPVQPIFWPGVVTPIPPLQAGSQHSRSASATPRTADDSYTPTSLLLGQGSTLLSAVPAGIAAGVGQLRTGVALVTTIELVADTVL